MTVVDWNALMQQAQQSAALPGADYDMVVVSCDAVNASTGKLMYKARMQVESGSYQGRHLTNNFVISPDSPTALRIFFRHMTAFGLDANFFASNPVPDTVARSLIGRRALVTLGLRKWRGEDQNEITQVSPPRGAPSGMPTVPAQAAPVQAVQPQVPAAQTQPAPQQSPPTEQVAQPQPASAPAPQQVPVPQPEPVPQSVPAQVPVPEPAPLQPQPQPQQPSIEELQAQLAAAQATQNVPAPQPEPAPVTQPIAQPAEQTQEPVAPPPIPY